LKLIDAKSMRTASRNVNKFRGTIGTFSEIIGIRAQCAPTEVKGSCR
jgi:hypothetical protein